MNRDKTVKDFFNKLESLPDPNLTDKKTLFKLQERLDRVIRPEIEKQDKLQARALSRSFTRVVR